MPVSNIEHFIVGSVNTRCKRSEYTDICLSQVNDISCSMTPDHKIHVQAVYSSKRQM